MANLACSYSPVSRLKWTEIDRVEECDLYIKFCHVSLAKFFVSFLVRYMYACIFFPVELILQSLPDLYLDKLLDFLVSQLESSPHIQFYLEWCQQALMLHGPRLKQRSQSIMSTLRGLQKNLTRRHDDLAKM